MVGHRSSVSVVIGLLFLISGNAIGQDLQGNSGARVVWAAATEDGTVLRDVRSGDEVPVPDLSARVTTEGGTTRWVTALDWNDELGFRHVVLDQYYRPNPGNAMLPPECEMPGVRVERGGLRLHYRNDGVLYYMTGAVFDNIDRVGTIRLSSAAAAQARAWALLAGSEGYGLADLAAVGRDVATELEEETELMLVSSGDGRTFGFVWKVPVLTASGQPLVATVDAGTGELLKSWDPTPHWRPVACGPRSNLREAGTAQPQNTSLNTRSPIYGTPSSATPGYTHEAFWPAVTGEDSPPITGYAGTGGVDGCSELVGDQYYKLQPLQGVYYGGDPSLVRQALGDAMWKTHETMDVFAALGWDSYNGQGGAAKVVVNADCGRHDDAKFVHSIEGDAPRWSVAVCPREAADFQFSAALDTIAHEWGHGVLISVGYDPWNHPLYHQEELQLHEGFADVVGHIVEWETESEGPLDGSVPEHADWVNNEDCDTSAQLFVRSAYKDDGANGLCYHAADTCSNAIPHYRGNQVAVAFWLLADGRTGIAGKDHKNPLCQRASPPQGVDCNLIVPTLNRWDASRIFFRVLTVYMDMYIGDGEQPANQEWNAVAEFGKQAAHDLFHVWTGACNDALDKQQAVQDAFSAIGYPGPTPDHLICEHCGCPY